MGHYIEYCRVCKKVIGTCRCLSKDKEVRYGICSKCKESLDNEIVTRSQTKG